jgi:hypothetical protein
MGRDSIPANTRLRLESRTLFGVLIFVAVVAAGIEIVERWRHGGQEAYEGDASPPTGSPCTPAPLPWPAAGHGFYLLSDSATGACLLRYESAAAPTAQVSALLDMDNAPPCHLLTQYWRLDTQAWCVTADAARGGCDDHLCVWRGADAKTWFARWNTKMSITTP